MHEICRASQILPLSSRRVESKSWFERPVHLSLCGIFGARSNWRGHHVCIFHQFIRSNWYISWDKASSTIQRYKVICRMCISCRLPKSKIVRFDQTWVWRERLITKTLPNPIHAVGSKKSSPIFFIGHLNQSLYFQIYK